MGAMICCRLICHMFTACGGDSAYSTHCALVSIAAELSKSQWLQLEVICDRCNNLVALHMKIQEVERHVESVQKSAVSFEEDTRVKTEDRRCKHKETALYIV